AKLEELWARALGDEREEIGRVITDFDAALQSNDMARVDEVRRRASVYLAIETS
ncbi:molecular chaperone HscC, partial [Escherichia coli]